MDAYMGYKNYNDIDPSKMLFENTTVWQGCTDTEVYKKQKEIQRKNTEV